MYQVKFTELLFGSWESLDELIGGFKQLKEDFDLIPLDFRQRIFNRDDFESLKRALNKILLALPKDTIARSNFSGYRSFFIELNIFMKFKSLLFSYDFCTEFKKIPDILIYENTFKSIQELDLLFNSITNQLSESNPNLILKFVDLSSIQKQQSNSKILSLEEMTRKFLALFVAHKEQQIEESESILKSLISYLKSFDYIDHNLSNLKETSRFEYAEFVADLNKVLSKQEITDVEIKKQFLNCLFKISKNFINFQSSIVCWYNDDEKREFLELSRTFFIFYNQ